MKKTTYIHNGVLYNSWDDCRKAFPSVIFPDEDFLTEDCLKTFEIKKEIVEVPDTLEFIRERQLLVRNLRNELLKDTDKYMLRDFPIEQVMLDSVIAYRQYLRDYPEHECWWNENPLKLEDWLDKGSGDFYE